jgi:uroporphyrin-III C-methyltransferase
VSGHDEGAFAAAVRGLQPETVTLVVMMGLARRTAIAESLIAGGWPDNTPAAIILGASRPDQEVWRGTLAGLAGKGDNHVLGGSESDGQNPGTIVIGHVVTAAGSAQTDAERIYVNSR